MYTIERYYGTVSYAPNNRACRVRVSISQPNGIPLCVKAIFGKSDRHRLTKGAVVGVERALQDDATRYAVTHVYDDRKEHLDRGDSTMSASKDKVRFFLPHRYFQTHFPLSGNGMRRDICKNILFRAFGMGREESEARMHRFPDGFWIECRPSQFARFIVYRHEDGQCINGIKDLKPEIVGPLTLPEKIARRTGVDEHHVRRVMAALDYDAGPEQGPVDTINVADRFDRPGCE